MDEYLNYLPALISDKSEGLPENKHFVCKFCTKMFSNKENQYSDSYCSFCLRFGYSKDTNHILMLTFKSLIGYLWFECKQEVWTSQILDYIDIHRKIGLLNPVFNYDDAELIWFLDFNKVGPSKTQISLENILKTIINILTCFNMPLLIPDANYFMFYNKYKSAILRFYETHHRPRKRRLLNPTLFRCLRADENIFLKTRDFKLEFLKSY